MTASENGFFHRAMLVTSVAVGLADVVCMRLAHISVSLASVGGFAIWNVGLLVLYGYTCLTKWPRMQQATLLVIWANFTTELFVFLVCAAARSPFPLRDGALASADALFGVHVSAMVDWTVAHHKMWIALVLPYGLMLPMIVAAMLLPTMTARFNVAKRLTVSCLSSLALGTAVFFFLPAIGPWAVYGFKPNRLQIDCENALKLLRAPGTVSLGKVASAGLICFPSFHVALALLALSALWQFRRLRYPAAVLSILQIISTLTTGWHYFADVLGGFVVAGFGLVCAHWFEHAEARWNARHGWLIASAGAAVSPDTGRPAEVPKAAEPVLAS